MTATTTTLGTRRVAGTVAHLRPMAGWIVSIASLIGTRWSAFVDSGQLGPSDHTVASRHAGSRI